MKQRLGSDPLSWIRDTRTSQEDTNTGERDGTTAAPAAPTAPAAPAPSTNDTNTGERDAATAAAPAAPTNDANTGERDAATAAAPAAPAASTKKTNTTERVARPAASTKKANTGERAARRKPAQAAQAGPAGPAAPANDTNTGELPGEEALRALIARELAGMAPRRGRPRTNLREVTKSSQEGLPENWTRATFIVRETLLEDLKDCAYTRRKTIRDVLDEALTAYLSGQELLRRPR